MRLIPARLLHALFVGFTLMMVSSCSTTTTHSGAPFCTDGECGPGARIAIVGDLQRTGPVEVWRERNDAERERLVRQLADERPNALVLLGDMVWWGASEEEWSYFDRIMTPVRDLGIPMLPILGNHEYYGSDVAALAAFHRRFSDVEDTYYVRMMDSIAFVMLNTNTDELPVAFMRAQAAWFRKTMKKLDHDSAVVAIVVCGHHPPYTNSTVVDDDKVMRRHFVPAFVESKKGALWLSGHCHAYEHFMKDGKHFVVSGGGGGPRQSLYQAAGQRRHDDLYPGGPIRPFHYLLMQRIGTTVVVTMRPLEQRGSATADETFAVTVQSSPADVTSRE